MADMPLLLCLVLTAAFASAACYCAYRCMSPLSASGGWSTRINNAAHLAMSVTMVTMIWWPPLFAPWQIAAFAVAAAWFVVQATGLPLTRASAWTALITAAPPSRAPHERGTTHRVRCLHHAAVMVGMAWMLTIASRTPGRSMSMRSMQAPAPMPSTRVALLLGGCFIVAAVILLGGKHAVRRPDAHGTAVENFYHAVMTGGMGIMVLAMA